MADPGKENNRRGPKSKRETAQYAFAGDYETEQLMRLAIGTALSGGACRIGLSRDGGALALGMYMGDDYGTEYIRPGDEMEIEVNKISEAWGVPLATYDTDAERWKIA